jgi:hypothetical protein
MRQLVWKPGRKANTNRADSYCYRPDPGSQGCGYFNDNRDYKYDNHIGNANDNPEKFADLKDWANYNFAGAGQHLDTDTTDAHSYNHADSNQHHSINKYGYTINNRRSRHKRTRSGY